MTALRHRDISELPVEAHDIEANMQDAAIIAQEWVKNASGIIAPPFCAIADLFVDGKLQEKSTDLDRTWETGSVEDNTVTLALEGLDRGKINIGDQAYVVLYTNAQPHPVGLESIYDFAMGEQSKPIPVHVVYHQDWDATKAGTGWDFAAVADALRNPPRPFLEERILEAKDLPPGYAEPLAGLLSCHYPMGEHESEQAAVVLIHELRGRFEPNARTQGPCAYNQVIGYSSGITRTMLSLPGSFQLTPEMALVSKLLEGKPDIMPYYPPQNFWLALLANHNPNPLELAMAAMMGYRMVRVRVELPGGNKVEFDNSPIQALHQPANVAFYRWTPNTETAKTLPDPFATYRKAMENLRRLQR